MRSTVAVLAFLLAVCASPICKAEDVAVIVGVSHYLNSNKSNLIEDLQYADDDARMVANTLTAHCGFKEKYIIVLTSKPIGKERKSTAANIVAAIAEATSSKHWKNPSTSKFIFYFSGHGTSTNSVPMIAATDLDLSKPKVGSHSDLTLDKLIKRFCGYGSKSVLTIFDMCRSGNVSQKNQTFGDIIADSKKNYHGDLVTVFSSTGRQSYENTDLQHGVFTYYLCNALTPQNKVEKIWLVPAMNSDGTVTVESLRRVVSDKISEESSFSGDSSNINDRKVNSGPFGPIGSGINNQKPEFFASSDNAMSSFVLLKLDPDTHRGAGSQSEAYKFLKEKGIQAYSKSDWVNARRYFADAKDAAQINSKQEAWCLQAIGVCFEAEKNLAKSREFYELALKVNPHFGEAMIGLGYLCRKEHDDEGARKWYEMARVERSTRVLGTFNLAELVASVDKNYELAEKLYEEVIRLNPALTQAAYNLACLYRDQNHNYSEAERLFKSAFEGSPRIPIAAYAIAVLKLENENDIDKFYSWLEKAFKFDSEKENMMSYFGQLLVDFRYNPKEAKAHGFVIAEKLYLASIESKPSEGLYHANYAYFLWKASRIKEMKAELATARKLGLKDHFMYDVDKLYR